MASPHTDLPKGVRPETVLLLCAGVYIGALLVFFLAGEGLFAAYLTLPGGFLAHGLADLPPVGSPLHSFLHSPAGDVLLLIAGASINVVSAYLVLRLLLMRTSIATLSRPMPATRRTTRSAWWRPPRWVWLWGAVYVAWLVNMVMDGQTRGAAYLTLPAGWVVLSAENLLAMGNPAAFTIAGASNVAVIFLSISGLRRLLEVWTLGNRLDDRNSG